MNPKRLFLITAIFLLASCSHKTPIRDSNLLKETELQKTIADFESMVNLIADEETKQAMAQAKVVDINGFQILYAKDNEIFILKNRNVIARINDRERIFYRSTTAPLSGIEVSVSDNLLFYNNSKNSFIDYSIDGVDVVERNYLDLLNLKNAPDKETLPNMSFVHHQSCPTLNHLSRTACCERQGYFFSPITGWERSQRITDKCRLLNHNQLGARVPTPKP